MHWDTEHRPGLTAGFLRLGGLSLRLAELQISNDLLHPIGDFIELLLDTFKENQVAALKSIVTCCFPEGIQIAIDLTQFLAAVF